MTECVTVAGLLAGYQPLGAQERRDLARIRRLADAERDPWLRSTPLHLTASALVVHPGSRRTLLRWHRRQQAWLQVGGHADPGERAAVAIATREAAEETGLTDLVPWPDASVLHIVIVPVPPGGGEPAHEHADIRFVLSTGSPEAIRSESSDAPLRWLTITQASEVTAEANLRESLARLVRLLPHQPHPEQAVAGTSSEPPDDAVSGRPG